MESFELSSGSEFISIRNASILQNLFHSRLKLKRTQNNKSTVYITNHVVYFKRIYFLCSVKITKQHQHHSHSELVVMLPVKTITYSRYVAYNPYELSITISVYVCYLDYTYAYYNNLLVRKLVKISSITARFIE